MLYRNINVTWFLPSKSPTGWARPPTTDHCTTDYVQWTGHHTSPLREERERKNSGKASKMR